MKLILLQILIGFLLSWAELQGLKRSVDRLLNSKLSGMGRGLLFVSRYVALAVVFWIFLELFRPNIFPFVLSFISSNLLLRYAYGRRIYA